MDKDKYAIIAENLSKGYKMYSSPKQKLLDLILPKGVGKTFYALKDLSFKVEKGEVVGLLGLNGSGKSTLSNILGGVSMPTQGKIEINGDSALITIGLGMNNFLTGIENIELKALMMGYKKDQIESIKQEIIDFADIGEFINQPLRTYSSGMRSRLGFAISIYTNPDILVIDEALSVGDPTFTQKCLDKMNEFKKSGKTIFFVSHSLSQIKQFCNKAMWIEYGILREYGDVDVVLPHYKQYINEINRMTEKEKSEYKKRVLKDQEHSLLKEFKLIDYNLRRINPKGKVIKSVKLINNKQHVKEVLYNFDLTTFAFGFIPSLIRRKYDTAVIVLLVQVLNLLIVPFKFVILINFIVTAIAAVFTGKSYTDHLIEKQKYLPYDIWTKINREKDINNIRKHYKDARKRKIRIAVLSMAFIFASSTCSMVYAFKDNIIAVINKDDSKMQIKDHMIIAVTNKNEKMIIDSMLLVNSKNNVDLQGVVYPGKIQVKFNNEYNELSNVVDLDNIDILKEILKLTFNLNISDYSIIEVKNDNNKDSIGMYTEIIENIISSSKDEIGGKINEILKLNKDINKEKLESFVEQFAEAKVDISKLKYETILLKEIVDEEKLRALELMEISEYKFLTTDKRNLINNVLVKDINTKYEQYLINKENESTISIEDNEGYDDIEENFNSNPGNDNGMNSGNVNNSTTDTPTITPTPPIIEESAPPVEEPTPPVEESKPPVEEPIPPVEEPIPPVEEPIPPVEEPIPPVVEPDQPEENGSQSIDTPTSLGE